MVVSWNVGTPKWMVYNWFRGFPILGNVHIPYRFSMSDLAPIMTMQNFTDYTKSWYYWVFPKMTIVTSPAISWSKSTKRTSLKQMGYPIEDNPFVYWMIADIAGWWRHGLLLDNIRYIKFVNKLMLIQTISVNPMVNLWQSTKKNVYVYCPFIAKKNNRIKLPIQSVGDVQANPFQYDNIPSGKLT